MYDYSGLKKLIRIHFGSYKNFAEALGIGVSTLYTKLNNVSYFTQDEIVKSKKLLQIKTSKEMDNLFFTTK